MNLNLMVYERLCIYLLKYQKHSDTIGSPFGLNDSSFYTCDFLASIKLDLKVTPSLTLEIQYGYSNPKHQNNIRYLKSIKI